MLPSADFTLDLEFRNGFSFFFIIVNTIDSQLILRFVKYLNISWRKFDFVAGGWVGCSTENSTFSIKFE